MLNILTELHPDVEFETCATLIDDQILDFFALGDQVIFSCLTLWSMMCREASSLWTSSTVMPI